MPPINSQFQKAQEKALYDLIFFQNRLFICWPGEIKEIRNRLSITFRQFSKLLDSLYDQELVKIYADEGYVYVEKVEEGV
jgi:hypothetical protein